MGILDEVRRRQTGGHRPDLHRRGRQAAPIIPADFTGGDIEILPRRPVPLLYERTPRRCEYVFGDSITSLTETPDGVHVTFERAAPRTFDLVVGADGIHSNVRRLAFGPEADYVTHLGHYYALADLGVDRGEPVMYNEPGRWSPSAARRRPRSSSSPPSLAYDRYDPEPQKEILDDAFAGVRLADPGTPGQLPDAQDSTSTPSAGPTSTATPRAGSRCSATPPTAPPSAGSAPDWPSSPRTCWPASWPLPAATTGRPSRATRPCSAPTPRSPAGQRRPVPRPAHPARIRMRNRMFKRRCLLRSMLKITDKFATAIDLKDYPAPAGTADGLRNRAGSPGT